MFSPPKRPVINDAMQVLWKFDLTPFQSHNFNYLLQHNVTQVLLPYALSLFVADVI